MSSENLRYLHKIELRRVDGQVVFDAEGFEPFKYMLLKHGVMSVARDWAAVMGERLTAATALAEDPIPPMLITTPTGRVQTASGVLVKAIAEFVNPLRLDRKLSPALVWTTRRFGSPNVGDGYSAASERERKTIYEGYSKHLSADVQGRLVIVIDDMSVTNEGVETSTRLAIDRGAYEVQAMTIGKIVRKDSKDSKAEQLLNTYGLGSGDHALSTITEWGEVGGLVLTSRLARLLKANLDERPAKVGEVLNMLTSAERRKFNSIYTEVRGLGS